MCSRECVRVCAQHFTTPCQLVDALLKSHIDKQAIRNESFSANCCVCSVDDDGGARGTCCQSIVFKYLSTHTHTYTHTFEADTVKRMSSRRNLGMGWRAGRAKILNKQTLCLCHAAVGEAGTQPLRSALILGNRLLQFSENNGDGGGGGSGDDNGTWWKPRQLKTTKKIKIKQKQICK